ncbi:hypothetical protein M407DRAFT_22020 [Tulasnella calospora MUT 4182]|uniref:Uncharacterized protein n=1 Tax=Tulasnella calospora MUT 4182 TaxID=1051891 RepID=A0A0C3QNN9_9AGAM|nr:hypothetical protein M407DRAFT_22020 [Tulasnella calospora MUT 4182]
MFGKPLFTRAAAASSPAPQFQLGPHTQTASKKPSSVFKKLLHVKNVFPRFSSAKKDANSQGTSRRRQRVLTPQPSHELRMVLDSNDLTRLTSTRLANQLDRLPRSIYRLAQSTASLPNWIAKLELFFRSSLKFLGQRLSAARSSPVGRYGSGYNLRSPSLVFPPLVAFFCFPLIDFAQPLSSGSTPIPCYISGDNLRPRPLIFPTLHAVGYPSLQILAKGVFAARHTSIRRYDSRDNLCSYSFAFPTLGTAHYSSLNRLAQRLTIARTTSILLCDARNAAFFYSLHFPMLQAKQQGLPCKSAYRRAPGHHRLPGPPA